MILRSLSVLFASSLLCAAATVPRPAPELLIKHAGRGETRLSSFKGKVVALEFILTTCQHCQNSSQKINAVYNELGPRGFTAVGVAVNPMAQMSIPEFVQTLRINYLVGYQNQDAADEFLRHDPKLVMYFPQFVLIDRKGVIRYQFTGTDKHFDNEEKSLREKVLLLLKEGAAAPGKK